MIDGSLTSVSWDATAGPGDVGNAAEASLRSLRRAAIGIADLTLDAIELDDRVALLDRREREIELASTALAEAEAAHSAAAFELARRETDLAGDIDALQLRAERLDEQQARLVEADSELHARERELEAQARRLHWRWLLRMWRWRPPLAGRDARVCELLFVPCTDGYRLLEQEGVALQRGAKLCGLLGERNCYVVTKIAPWQLDGRWCAYLQQDEPTDSKGAAK